MVKANEAHYKQMLRLIRYTLTTKELHLKQKLIKGPWKINRLCDSDYAGDNDSRKSVTGYIIYVNGLIICWKSKGQNIVTLSSTEAEYVAATDLTTELLFVKQIMNFLGMEMDEKMNIKLDNSGALSLAENKYACQRTKHIDIRYHFIRQHVENGTIQIELIKSEDNTADVFTKNLGHKSFWKHIYKLMEWNYNDDDNDIDNDKDNDKDI